MYGKLLRIDLSSGESRREQIPEEWCREYIGVSGLAARLLWEALSPQCDVLNPDSPLLWITGPLTGTSGPATGRFTICGRSPQTGLWGEANIGGFVGTELRKAGFDAIWMTGKAPNPVYVWIHNGNVELRTAEHLWGQADTYETQARIRQELDDNKVKVASIGLAGENLISFANIMSDHGRMAGRAGFGALMGSKLVKALAVRGEGEIELTHTEAYKRLRVEVNRNLREQNMTSIFHALGTSGSADYLQIIGDMPQKYWTAPVFEGATRISGAEMAATILTGTTACHACVIGCGREIHVPDGLYATPPKSKGPEYETVCAFGSQLLIDDLPGITKLGDVCDRYGMDSISAGNIIALACLLREKDLISPEAAQGTQLEWGNVQTALDCVGLIARKEGLGALMALGSLALAEHFGVPELAVQINGLDVPMHDPRAHSGQALAYVTSPRGACHNQSDFFTIEMGGTLEEIGIGMPERWQDSGKAELVKLHQHWRTVCNSLVTCFFAVVSPSEIAELLQAATGMQRDVAALMKAGERAWNLKRMINIRLGLTRETEKLPKLLLEPLMEGGQEGHLPDMQVLLSEYYQSSDWDEDSGQPTPNKLKELGLEFTL